ncbi:MAG: molybdopterin-guanine dinucleotide biosynthesis protein B [Anaerolineales bacterium]|nr:molybdopterin-guanine dinucleotide biosynthesis protein B [Anaerolineales bacterium]
MMTPLVSFVGKSGVGKTTLIEKLIAELKRRGYRIAVVKHHAHTTPIDGRGKDSWRLAEAGASVAIVSSPVEIARFERVTRELTLDEIAARIDNVDLILTEGFKREAAPKIEVSRAAVGTDLIGRAEELIAVVSDHPIALALPRFDLDDITGIASFIERKFLRGG